MPDLYFFFAFFLICSRFDGTMAKKWFGFYNFGFCLFMNQILWIMFKYLEQWTGGEKINFVDHININWQVFGLFILVIGLENILIYSPRNNGFVKLILSILNFAIPFAYAGFFYLLYR